MKYLFIKIIICGIFNSNLIQVHCTDIMYLGCYSNINVFDRILKAQHVSNLDFLINPYMSVPWCTSYCHEFGYIYAGVETGIDCYCDSIVPNDLQSLLQPEISCSVPCVGNITTICGGFFHIGIYHLNFTMSTSAVTGNYNTDVTTDVTMVFNTSLINNITTELYTTDQTTTEYISSTDGSLLTNTTSSQPSSEKTETASTSTTETASTSTTETAPTSTTETASTSTAETASTSTTETHSTSTTETASTSTTKSASTSTALSDLISTVPMTTENVHTVSTPDPTITSPQQTGPCITHTLFCRCFDVESKEFVEKLQDLIHEISVDKKMTSLHVNSKISVEDKRMSSTTIGYVGALCLSLPLLLMLAVDIINCFTRKRKYVAA